jgi:beta-phosphoglucomutase
MDGVLVDSYEAHFLSWRTLARAHGLKMTRHQFAATFGQTSRDIITTLWKVPDEKIAAWDAEKEALYRKIILADFPEMDGAGELIAALARAGFKLAIGSSGPPENVEAVMQRLPNAEIIDATVNGMEVTHGKPDPEVFLVAAKKLGIQPRRCAVVEDAPAGIEAARRAGMAAVALTGTAARQKLAENADVVVDCLRELTPEQIARLIDAERRK